MRYKQCAKFDVVMSVTQEQSLSSEGIFCVLMAPQYVCVGSVGVSPKLMRSDIITFEKGAGFNFIRENVLPHRWQGNILADVALPSLDDAI